MGGYVYGDGEDGGRQGAGSVVSMGWASFFEGVPLV